METKFHTVVASGVIEEDGRFTPAYVLAGEAHLTGVSADAYHELLLVLNPGCNWHPRIWVDALLFTPSRTSGGRRVQPVNVVVVIEDDGKMMARGIILDDVFIKCSYPTATPH